MTSFVQYSRENLINSNPAGVALITYKNLEYFPSIRGNFHTSSQLFTGSKTVKTQSIRSVVESSRRLSFLGEKIAASGEKNAQLLSKIFDIALHKVFFCARVHNGERNQRGVK